MGKETEENNFTITINTLLREFNLYFKFMCADKNNDNNKTNVPPLSFHSSYSFLNCWKAAKTLKFWFWLWLALCFY